MPFEQTTVVFEPCGTITVVACGTITVVGCACGNTTVVVRGGGVVVVEMQPPRMSGASTKEMPSLRMGLIPFNKGKCGCCLGTQPIFGLPTVAKEI